MATISETALGYESDAKISNIADLEFVSTNADIKEETNTKFPYKYVEVSNHRYRVPKSVLQSLKAVLEENPKLQKFKVKKSGNGMDTIYTLIPLA
jgi:hypothetical protein